jgi:hypothetical protein
VPPISTISGRGHCSQNLCRLCAPLEFQVVPTQNAPARSLAHISKVGDMELQLSWTVNCDASLKEFGRLTGVYRFADPMEGTAAAPKVDALTRKIKLWGGARTLILGLCKVGWGPSRWATAVLHISTISGPGQCAQILVSLRSKKIPRVTATQNFCPGALYHFIKLVTWCSTSRGPPGATRP